MMEELSRLPGLGPARVRALEKAGVRTLRDLVMRLPVAYRDLTAPTPLSQARPGLACAVAVRVVGEATEQAEADGADPAIAEAGKEVS